MTIQDGLRMCKCVCECVSMVWDSKIIPKQPLEKHKECLDAFAYNEVRMGLGGLMTIPTEGTRGQVPAHSGCCSKFLITIKKTLWHITNAFSFHSLSFVSPPLSHLKWNSLPMEFQKGTHRHLYMSIWQNWVFFPENIWQIKKRKSRWQGINRRSGVEIDEKKCVLWIKSIKHRQNCGSANIFPHRLQDENVLPHSLMYCIHPAQQLCGFVWSVAAWRIEQVHRDPAD